MVFVLSFSCSSILVQWTCSLMARLTLQFFYPSLICTISSIIFFVKPFIIDILTNWQYVFLHLVWLCNYTCSPFIYAYFNERMRLTYGKWLTCSALRKCISKYERQYRRKHGESLRRLKRLNISASAKNLYWRDRNNQNNFVRSSLQIQSRDLEQFCEVMMSVNTANGSSEGWTENDSDIQVEPFTAAIHKTTTTPPHTSQQNNNINNGKSIELYSLIFDLGRQTVKQRANIAKKTSF